MFYKLIFMNKPNFVMNIGKLFNLDDRYSQSIKLCVVLYAALSFVVLILLILFKLLINEILLIKGILI